MYPKFGEYEIDPLEGVSLTLPSGRDLRRGHLFQHHCALCGRGLETRHTVGPVDRPPFNLELYDLKDRIEYCQGKTGTGSGTREKWEAYGTGQGQAPAPDSTAIGLELLKGRGINSRRPRGGFSPQVKGLLSQSGSHSGFFRELQLTQ